MNAEMTVELEGSGAEEMVAFVEKMAEALLASAKRADSPVGRAVVRWEVSGVDSVLKETWHG